MLFDVSAHAFSWFRVRCNALCIRSRGQAIRAVPRAICLTYGRVFMPTGEFGNSSFLELC